MDLEHLEQKIKELETESSKKNRILHFVKSYLMLAQDKISSEELRDAGLEMIVDCTDSQGGYLHFFNENEQVIDLAAWSKAVHTFCDAEATIHYPIEEAGIWADAARKRCTVVHNDYQSIPDNQKGGLPEGHFPLYRHMSCPVIDSSKLVCIIGVGNKETDYTSLDIEITEILCSIIWMIFQQQKAKEILKKYSFEDPLTGLANKRRFNEVMTVEWNRLRRINKSLALIMIDIDFFKKYNDSLGHNAGDLSLAKIANCLKTCFRRTGELVTRFGGEEFAVIIPYATADKAQAHAEEACKKVHDLGILHPKSSASNFVTISAGVASIVPDKDSFHKLVELADKQLYKAKSEGRNRVSTLTIDS